MGNEFYRLQFPAFLKNLLSVLETRVDPLERGHLGLIRQRVFSWFTTRILSDFHGRSVAGAYAE